MTIEEQLKVAQMNYVRSGSTVVSVIQDMERELQRMRSKNISQDFIDAKDKQIQEIVSYYNQVDDLFQFYKLLILNLKVQLQETCEFILKHSANDKKHQECLIKYLTLTSKPTDGQNTQTHRE